MSGILYLIPNTLGKVDENSSTPLSNIIPADVQAITSRLDHFVAENAKTTRAFLKIVNVATPLAQPIQAIQITELNINTSADALPALLQPLLDGHDVGLISEAGVPAVADPGANLVNLAHQKGIEVRPLVGPSSILMSVMASGLNGQSFAFNGYLPTDAGQRAKRIKTLEERSQKDHQTQLFIETPYRNHALLEAITAACHDQTMLCVATDISLPTEHIQTKSIAQWKKDIQHGKSPDFHKKPTVFLFLAA